MPKHSSMKEYFYKFSNINRLFSEDKIKFEDFIKMYESKDFSSIPWYDKDVDVIVDTIKSKYTNEQTFCGYINCLVIVFSHNIDKHSLLRQLYMDHKKQIDDNRKENPTENARVIDINDDIINDCLSKLKDLRSKLLFVLYASIPPRRLDYRHLKYVKYEPESAEDNYLIYNDDGTFTLIFNEYKTKDKYKRQEFTITNDICCRVVSTYLIKSRLEYGLYVFPTVTGKKFNSSMFSMLLTNIFTNAFCQYTTLNDIRHSWANKINKDLSTMNVREIEMVTNMMGHSINESLKYRRL